MVEHNPNPNQNNPQNDAATPSPSPIQQNHDARSIVAGRRLEKTAVLHAPLPPVPPMGGQDKQDATTTRQPSKSKLKQSAVLAARALQLYPPHQGLMMGGRGTSLLFKPEGSSRQSTGRPPKANKA